MTKQEDFSKLNENRIGAYSGSERLEDPAFIEPDADNPEMAKMWLDEIIHDEEFITEQQKKLDAWKKILSMSCDPNDVHVHMVGESHIDIAWLWRYEQTRKKGAVTARKAVYHSRRYPGKFCYALSEPILLQWIKEDDPDLFKDIQETVKAGGIELVGGSFVEPDCMMPCGEAMVRTRLYGQRFYRTHFGQLADVEWFLDSFGYNWGLPQILSKSGAKYFWTSKITWNRQNLFPFINFWWEGVDGTRLLTCNFPMGNGSLDNWVMYEMGHHPVKEGIDPVWNYKRDFTEDIDEEMDLDAIIPDVGCFFGKGDGGHGPTHQEVAEAMVRAELPGTIFHWSRVANFFTGVESLGPRLPIWQDELYLEEHRGTFSVHAEVKRHNRLFENWLLSTEALACVSTALAGNLDLYPQDSLEATWKTLLKGQFHDVLPGTSIPEVYDDVYEDWIECTETLGDLDAGLGSRFVGPEGTGCDLFLWNNLSWDRKARVFIPLSMVKGDVTLDAAGKPPYATVTLHIGSEVTRIAQPVAAEPDTWVDPRPAGWWAVVDLKALSVTPTKVRVEDVSLEALDLEVGANGLVLGNGIIKIELDASTGAIQRFAHLDICETHAVSNLVQGDQNELTQAYEDKSKAWPAWNLTPKYWEFPIEMESKADAIRVVDQGPVFATVEVGRTLGEKKSSVLQRYTVFKGHAELYCDYIADWKQEMVMLKVGIDTTTKAESCTAEVMFGAIERSSVPETPADQARYEKICHKYHDVSAPDRKWGIATLNEGKYAFDADGGRSRLTMLRSPPYPGPAGESWAHKERRLRKVKYGTEVPMHSGMGPFRCKYAYLPHFGGALLKAKGTPNPVVYRAADEFNFPVKILQGGTGTGVKVPVSGGSYITISAPNVKVSALKRREWDQEPHMILRLVETVGSPGETEIHLHPLLARRVEMVREVDLLERPLDGDKVAYADGTFTTRFTKFEVKSFELVLKGNE